MDVSVNPRHAENYVIEPIVLDAANLFLMSDGQTVKNYTLVFRVYEPNDSSDSLSESDENADSENESVSTLIERIFNECFCDIFLCQSLAFFGAETAFT